MKKSLLSLAASLLMAGSVFAAPQGRILILDNEILIEGDIRRDGNQYTIRRGSGETSIPTDRVIDLVADRQQAYQVMRQRCNRHDFDDRMHFIRWCMENALRQEALAEAELLHQFRPDDPQLSRLVEGLRMLSANKTEAAPAPPPPPAVLSDKVQDVEPLDYNRESFGLFVSRVQPILMNVCARCHAKGEGGGFGLLGIVEGGDRKATLYNLTSTLKQLKKTDPGSSPLLEKAVTAHGKSAQPPLRDRQTPAYQYLERWVQAAVGTGEAVSLPPPTPVTVSTPSPPPTVHMPLPAVSTAKSAPKMIFGETSKSQVKQTTAKDPFDPAIFNGTIEPKKD